jgi:hypothetical protein
MSQNTEVELSFRRAPRQLFCQHAAPPNATDPILRVHRRPSLALTDGS